MINHNSKKLIFVGLVVAAGVFLSASVGYAQRPRPIKIKKYEEKIMKRMPRTITLDVRDMNIVDVTNDQPM